MSIPFLQPSKKTKIVGLLQANTKTQERRKGDAGHKRGSSHKGGDLNSWKESHMQNAWVEYKE